MDSPEKVSGSLDYTLRIAALGNIGLRVKLLSHRVAYEHMQMFSCIS